MIKGPIVYSDRRWYKRHQRSGRGPDLTVLRCDISKAIVYLHFRVERLVLNGSCRICLLTCKKSFLSASSSSVFHPYFELGSVSQASALHYIITFERPPYRPWRLNLESKSVSYCLLPSQTCSRVFSILYEARTQQILITPASNHTSAITATPLT